MAWYQMTGQDQDVVLYTDVRLVRNLSTYPFTHRLDAVGAREIIASVGDVLEKNGFFKIDFADISRAEAYSLVEQQYVSIAFVKESLPHALYLNEPCSMSAMLCAEDHVSLQCILAGRAIGEAYTSVSRIENQIDERFEMAFAEGRGYLSPFTQNVGNGLKISVVLCLPTMAEARKTDRWIETLSGVGVCFRSVRNEQGRDVGSLFHLSYRPPVNQNEAEAIAFVEAILSAIIAEERSVPQESSLPAAEERADRIMRAVGTLHHALIIRVPELLDLLADVRLGIRLGIVTNVNPETLTALMIESLPATLSIKSTVETTSRSSDAVTRASCAKERLIAALCTSVVTA